MYLCKCEEYEIIFLLFMSSFKRSSQDVLTPENTQLPYKINHRFQQEKIKILNDATLRVRPLPARGHTNMRHIRQI